MNEPIEEHNGDPNLRYAEYALGVLEADARDAVASEIATSAEAAAAVARWEIRLLPLAELIPEEPPAAHLLDADRPGDTGLEYGSSRIASAPERCLAVARTRHRRQRARSCAARFRTAAAGSDTREPFVPDLDDSRGQRLRGMDCDRGPAARSSDRGTGSAGTAAVGPIARALGDTRRRATRCARHDRAGAANHLGAECRSARSGGTVGPARGLR